MRITPARASEISPGFFLITGAPKLAFGVVFTYMYHIVLPFTMKPYADRRIASGGGNVA